MCVWGGGGGGRKVQNIEGAKVFAVCILIGVPAPISANLTLKTYNIAKLRIELIGILLEIPSNKIKGTYIKLVHL